jgi:hypothetical protein
LISSEYVNPTKWFDEIEKYEYQYSDIIEVIEIYEFVIATLINSVSFIKVDESLLNKIKSIHDKEDYYINKYFNGVKDYKDVFKIHLMGPENKHFHSGVYYDENLTKRFYFYWNKYYNFIFGEKNEYPDRKNELSNNDTEKPDNYDVLANYIKIPDIKWNGILNLLNYFDRKKMSYINKQILLSGNIQEGTKRESTDLTSVLLLNLFDQINHSTGKTIETIEDASSMTQQKIIEDGEKTRELINEALEVSNEILNAVKEKKELLSYGCAEKIWMHARHPEFDKPLQALINKGFVEENSYHYTWKERQNKEKGFGINIFVYYILQNANLSKWADSIKFNNAHQNKNDYSGNKDDDNKGIFTKRVWEPFNVAFKTINFENNARAISKPKNYDKFINLLNKDTSINITLK